VIILGGETHILMQYDDTLHVVDILALTTWFSLLLLQACLFRATNFEIGGGAYLIRTSSLFVGTTQQSCDSLLVLCWWSTFVFGLSWCWNELVLDIMHKLLSCIVRRVWDVISWEVVQETWPYVALCCKLRWTPQMDLGLFTTQKITKYCYPLFL